MFDPRSDKGIFLGYSNNSRSFRVYNKCTLCVEDSVHVILDYINHVAKGIITGDEDINQDLPKVIETQKSKEPLTVAMQLQS